MTSPGLGVHAAAGQRPLRSSRRVVVLCPATVGPTHSDARRSEPPTEGQLERVERESSSPISFLVFGEWSYSAEEMRRHNKVGKLKSGLLRKSN